MSRGSFGQKKRGISQGQTRRNDRYQRSDQCQSPSPPQVPNQIQDQSQSSGHHQRREEYKEDRPRAQEQQCPQAQPEGRLGMSNYGDHAGTSPNHSGPRLHNQREEKSERSSRRHASGREGDEGTERELVESVRALNLQSESPRAHGHIFESWHEGDSASSASRKLGSSRTSSSRHPEMSSEREESHRRSRREYADRNPHYTEPSGPHSRDDSDPRYTPSSSRYQQLSVSSPEIRVSHSEPYSRGRTEELSSSSRPKHSTGSESNIRDNLAREQASSSSSRRRHTRFESPPHAATSTSTSTSEPPAPPPTQPPTSKVPAWKTFYDPEPPAPPETDEERRKRRREKRELDANINKRLAELMEEQREIAEAMGIIPRREE